MTELIPVQVPQFPPVHVRDMTAMPTPHVVEHVPQELQLDHALGMPAVDGDHDAIG